MTEDAFPLVSVLFVTYKRFDLLERAVRAFLAHTSYPNLEIVIADDGSGPEVQARIRALPAQRFWLASANRGLGANNNSGLKLCTGKYVLMIQDDWVCHGPSNYLEEAVHVMELNPEVGLINFAGALHPIDSTSRLSGSQEPCYLTPVPLMSEDGKRELSLYSDQPHLQSMECIQFLGPYRETPGMRSESYYEKEWRNQTKFKTAAFPNWHFRVFQCDYSAASFNAARFSRRSAAKLFPTAQWLKRNLKPVYWVGRAGFYCSVRTLETLRIVK